MSGILQRYIDLRIHFDRQRTTDLQQKLGRMDRLELEKHFAGAANVGNVFLLDSPGSPACVLEVVLNPQAGDSVATLYEGHVLFNSRDDYRRAREELITTINDFADAGTLGVLVMCPIRKRPTHLRDLGFHQLLELVRNKVAKFVGSSV